MTLREPLLAFLLSSPALTLQAQAPPPTPKPAPNVVAGIPVSHATKLYFPEADISKGDLARFYAS